MGIVIGCIAIAIIALFIIGWLNDKYKTVKDSLNNHTKLKEQHEEEVLRLQVEKSSLRDKLKESQEKLKTTKSIQQLRETYVLDKEIYTPFEKFRVMRLHRDLDQECAELKKIKELLELDITYEDEEKLNTLKQEILDLRDKDQLLYIKFLEGKKR